MLRNYLAVHSIFVKLTVPPKTYRALTLSQMAAAA
jgi:hypothetical protein